MRIVYKNSVTSWSIFFCFASSKRYNVTVFCRDWKYKLKENYREFWKIEDKNKSKDKRHVNFNKWIHLPEASQELLAKIWN